MYSLGPSIVHPFKVQALTQKLNDIMIEERGKTWEQDLAAFTALFGMYSLQPALCRMDGKPHNLDNTEQDNLAEM